MPGPTGTPCNTPPVDAGTLSRSLSGSPGVTKGTGKRRGPFLIHLDLNELAETEQPGVGKVQRSGSFQKVDVFVKGASLGKDPGRPNKVLAGVRKIFAPLKDVIHIELDTPAKSDRLLRARFGWPMVTSAGKPQVSKRYGQFYDPSYVGVGAPGQTRTRVGRFKPMKGDGKSGVTAYVFEGAIAIVIMDFFGGKANVDNIYAAAIAHELGHNLGLGHTKSATDIMFVYARQTASDQKRWMKAANDDKLRFSRPQRSRIRNLLRSK